MNKSIKSVRNLFAYRIPVIKLDVKELQSAKFYAMFLVLVMLVAIFSLSPVISSLMKDLIIKGTGRIATQTTRSITYKSEVRGIFIHSATYAKPVDHDLIAQTLENYGIQVVYGEWASLRGGWEAHAIRMARLAEAIPAFHAKGIEVHVSMDVLYAPKDTQQDLWVVDSDGNPYPWGCPTKEATRTFIKGIVEDIVTNYDIDGFMFDYIRYELSDQCYCQECKAKFEEWLGETIPDSNWPPNPSDFGPGGSRQLEFYEWRTIPVSELVRDMRSWMLAIKPDLEFSLAAWSYFDDSPIYWRKYIGQDTGLWIKNDYLDVVAPMMYTEDLASLQNMIESNLPYMVDGPEGKVRLVAFLDAGRKVLTPELFRDEINLVRSLGLDGWIIWRYGGPGAPAIEHDIQDFLDAIDLPDVFTLENILVSARDTQATIAWTTDLLATSKVEFSQSPLFTASWRKWRDSFDYWDIDHVPGTVIEDATFVTNHSITLSDLLPETKYYFRVQSQDSFGIATSNVLNFTTSGIS